jgi:hypothetical protein
MYRPHRAVGLALILAALLLVGCTPPVGKVEDATLRAEAELTVRGPGSRPPDKEDRDRTIPPSFQLLLKLENLTDKEMTLERPKLDGSPVAFVVDRWYEQGGIGAAWDGVLKAKEEKTVLVIGGLQGNVVPGQTISVRIAIGPLVLTQSAVVKEGEHQKCPCGCDRSGPMIAELRTQDRARARETIQMALSVIARREKRGYVTEQMISHRLRLLALERDLSP